MGALLLQIPATSSPDCSWTDKTGRQDKRVIQAEKQIAILE
jgi:hypothetical protein